MGGSSILTIIGAIVVIIVVLKVLGLSEQRRLLASVSRHVSRH